MLFVTAFTPPDTVNPLDPLSYFPAPDTTGSKVPPVLWQDARMNEGQSWPPYIINGTDVAILAIVKRDDDGFYLEVAHQPECRTDTFRVGYDTRNDHWALRAFNGRLVAAVVTVLYQIGRNSCHGSRYAIASPIRVSALPHNPPVSQVKATTPGSRFVVTGVFQGPSVPLHDIAAWSMRIGGPNGHTKVRTTAAVAYAGGSLENLKGKEPLRDEYVRAICSTNDKGELELLDGMLFLVEPDAGRLRKYTALRETVMAEVGKLSMLYGQDLFARARGLFAALQESELTGDEAHDALGVVAVNDQEYFLIVVTEALSGRSTTRQDIARFSDPYWVYPFWQHSGISYVSAAFYDILVQAIRVRHFELEEMPDNDPAAKDCNAIIRHYIAFIGDVRDPTEELVGFVVELINHYFIRGIMDIQGPAAEMPLPLEAQGCGRFGGILEQSVTTLKSLREARSPVALRLASDDAIRHWLFVLRTSGVHSNTAELIASLLPKR